MRKWVKALGAIFLTLAILVGIKEVSFNLGRSTAYSEVEMQCVYRSVMITPDGLVFMCMFAGVVDLEALQKDNNIPDPPK